MHTNHKTSKRPDKQQKKEYIKYTSDDAKRNIYVQWGAPIALLFVIVVIFVSNFLIISKNTANKNMNQTLIHNAEAAADEINNLINQITYAGQAAAAIIGNDNKVDYAEWKKDAERINRSMPMPYLVAIVEMNGQGVVSDAISKIDLSNQPYFESTLTHKYKIVENDGILQKPAFVSISPIYSGREAIGMIYIYVSMKDIQKLMEYKSYDNSVSFALLDGSYDIMYRTGKDSYFTEDDDFIKSVRNSKLVDFTMDKIFLRLDQKIKFSFQAEMGDEHVTIISVPVKLGQWQFISVIDQQYVDKVKYKEWSAARNMAVNLSVTVVIFLVVLAILSAINKFRDNEQKQNLVDKADTDLLTELNNKIATQRKIQEFVDENPDAQGLFFLFDIDNFKKINDTMGHAFGDEVLSGLGQQLRNEFRVTDIIGRIGGDEFVLFLKHINTQDQLTAEGNRICKFFDRFNVGEYVKYSATASIGAAVFPKDGKSYQELYRSADIALYEAKRKGKNQLAYYNKAMQPPEEETEK